LARIAPLLAGAHGKELKDKRQWIAVFFRYRQLKERGLETLNELSHAHDELTAYLQWFVERKDMEAAGQVFLFYV